MKQWGRIIFGTPCIWTKLCKYKYSGNYWFCRYEV